MMARVAGRNRWIAVPVGILCAAVVGALVWLAAPMIPVSVTWVGDTLRDASARQAASLDSDDGEVRRALADGGVDCRAAYPDSLWSELTWRGGSLLDQSTDAPPTGADALVDAIAPDVVVTCAWTSDAGTITTSFARVGDDAAGLADAALRGQGFACARTDDALRCDRGSAAGASGASEHHILRDGMWIVTAADGGYPEEFDARLEKHIWGW